MEKKFNYETLLNIKSCYSEITMEHRLFIAINPKQEIKEKVFKCKLNLPILPIYWTKQENLHITLSFLGNIKDEFGWTIEVK